MNYCLPTVNSFFSLFIFNFKGICLRGETEFNLHTQNFKKKKKHFVDELLLILDNINSLSIKSPNLV